MHVPLKVHEALLTVTQIRICAKDVSDIAAVKRLALRASVEVSPLCDCHLSSG